MKLNDIETTVTLDKNQMKGAKVLSKAVLVYGNIMQTMTTRVTALEKERKGIKESYKKLMLHSKRLRIDLNFMQDTYKKCQVAIKDEMVKKFKMLLNLDHMEMTVIKYMITKAKYNANDLKEQFNREIDVFKVTIFLTNILLKCLFENNTTLNDFSNRFFKFFFYQIYIVNFKLLHF